MSRWSERLQTRQAQARAAVAAWQEPRPITTARFFCHIRGKWYSAATNNTMASCPYCDAWNRGSDEPDYDASQPGYHGVWSER